MEDKTVFGAVQTEISFDSDLNAIFRGGLARKIFLRRRRSSLFISRTQKMYFANDVASRFENSQDERLLENALCEFFNHVSR